MNEELPTAEATSGWTTHQAGPVVVRAQAGSYAAKFLSDEARAAAAATAKIAELLGLPELAGSEPIEIVLVDAMPAAQANGAQAPAEPAPAEAGKSATIVRTIAPDRPRDNVAVALVDLLLARHRGLMAAPPLLIMGLAGQVNDSFAAANDILRTAMGDGVPLSVEPLLAAGTTPRPGSSLPMSQIATSFVGFLIARDGTAGLRRFIDALAKSAGEADSAQRCRAALRQVYGASSNDLESSWKASLNPNATGGLRAARELWSAMAPEFHPHRLRALAILLCMTVSPLSSQVLPFVMNHYDRLSAAIVIGLFVSCGLGALFTWVSARLSNDLVYSVSKSMQARLYRHLQSLSHRYYSRRDVRTGDLLSRLVRDVATTQQALSQMVIALSQVLMFAFSAIHLFFINAPLCGVLIVGVAPGIWLMQRHLRRRLESASSALGRSAGAVSAHYGETLPAYGLIKAYGLEDYVADQNESLLERQRTAGTDMGGALALSQSAIMVALGVGQILSWVVLMLQGNAEVASVFALVMPLLGPVIVLSSMLQSLQSAPSSIQRVNELLQETVDIKDGEKAVDHTIEREITFENVTFAYNDQPVLKHVDLTIPVGNKVAIVGLSGSGKSTILNMLLRFWDPREGSICFDGVDIRKIKLKSLRAQIGIVLQDTVIFNGSIRDNIAMGLAGIVDPKDISDAAIEAAGRDARLDQFVDKLPGNAGYATLLGERGAQMAGGQKQRIAIARAMLRKPRILVLDEATSALDPTTEREIQETLSAIAGGQTTVAITHRITSAMSADIIYVMHEGRVVEHGRHEQLLELRGHYWKLYNDQTQGGGPRGQLRIGGVERLRAIPLFAKLDADRLAALAGQLCVENFATGMSIVRQDEPGNKMYIVDRGRAEAWFNDGLAEHLVNVFNAGDFFGETALLTEQPRNASVVATETTQLFSLAKEDFDWLIEQDSGTRQTVEEAMQRRRAVLEEVMRQKDKIEVAQP